MPQIGPITDAYIDSIIKSAGVASPNPNKTQGTGMRELIKLLRGRLEQQSALAYAALPDGIIYGLGLSIVDQQLTVAPGVWKIGTIFSKDTSTILTLNAKDGTLSRYDAVYANTLGEVGVVTGTPGDNPAEPAIPPNSIRVGAILVTPESYTPTQPDLAGYVDFLTDQTINSIKTFTESPIVPIATEDNRAVNLGQINGNFIQNQNASAQPANLSIDGSGKFGTNEEGYAILNSSNIYFQTGNGNQFMYITGNQFSFNQLNDGAPSNAFLITFFNGQTEMHSDAGIVFGGKTSASLAPVDPTDLVRLQDLRGGGGYTSRSFNEILTFDENFKMLTTQTGDIAFSLGSGNVEDVQAKVTIIGDGIHACTFPNSWTNANGQTFDNQQKNIIYLEYDGVEVLYSTVKVIVPDIIPPYLVSAVINQVNKNLIVLNYNELLGNVIPAISDFSANLSKAVTAVSIAGSQVTVTVDTDYSYGDIPTISYSPGGNKIQDLAGNFAAALTNQGITNNVLPGTTSAFITNINQTLRTTVVPHALDFYGGSSIADDLPFSISFWINRNNTSSGRILHLYSTVVDTAPGYDMTITSGGNLNFLLGSHFLNRSVSGAVITPNTWTHVTVTYDGLKAGTGVKFYYNGNLVASTGDASYTGQMGAFDANIRLAVFSDIQTPPVNSLYNAKLDSLYFWNKELSNLEVLNVYNSGTLVNPATLAFAANLVVGYEFNNNTNDFGPNGYTLASTVPPTYSSDHV